MAKKVTTDPEINIKSIKQVHFDLIQNVVADHKDDTLWLKGSMLLNDNLSKRCIVSIHRDQYFELWTGYFRKIQKKELKKRLVSYHRDLVGVQVKPWEYLTTLDFMEGKYQRKVLVLKYHAGKINVVISE